MSAPQRQPTLGDDTGNGGGFEYLTDDLVVEILRRLTVEHLWLRCRRVCRRWYALISSPPFARAHLQQSPSTFFVWYLTRCTKPNFITSLDFIFPDNASRPFSVINELLVENWKLFGAYPVASCNGLVVFSSCRCAGLNFFAEEFYMGNITLLTRTYGIGKLNQIYIGNPITGELISIHNPSTFTLNGFCGFFYHSSRQEYKLLHCHKPDDTGVNFVYAMLTLGSTQWRNLCSLPHRVRPESPPVILDNTLYWMTHASFPTCEDSIIMFNMDSEEFRTMPHPSYSCQTSESHNRMNLLEMDGQLTCRCLLGQDVCAWAVDVSDRDNYTPASWVQIYHLNFNRSFESYFTREVPDNYHVNLVSVQNQELVLLWDGKRVFCYDLLTNCARKMRIGGVNEFPGDLYNDHLLLTRYTKSLISMNNFYPGLSEIHVA
ncbi:hypothetical protein V6N13_014394 [Hibiscus sabdariffa]|uniref:F-box domain-containing protein n=1 Tax=Hibiscus sabdariffa TaxID=183260 RepID=A0ABR2RVV4_9ROSI